MIFTTELFKIKKNHKRWEQGYLNFKKIIGDTIGWKEQVLHIAIFTEEDFTLTDDQLFEKVKGIREQLKRQQDANQLLAMLKEADYEID